MWPPTVNFDLLQSWASLYPILGNLQNDDIYISPWGTLLQIPIIGDSIATGKSVHLKAVHITNNAISRSDNNIYRDPNKRGDRSYKPKRKKNKGRKKANSMKGSSQSSIKYGSALCGIGKGKETIGAELLLSTTAIGNSIPFHVLAHCNLQFPKTYVYHYSSFGPHYLLSRD